MRPGRVTFRKATPGTGGTPAGSRVRGSTRSCPRAGALAAGLALALACLACLSCLACLASCERGAESAPDQPQGFPGAAGQGGYGGPVTLPDAAALAGAGGGLFTREAWEFSELTPEEKAEFDRLALAFREAGEEERLDILAAIGENFPGVELTAFALEVLATGDEELGLEAVSWLEGNTSPAILAPLERALEHPSEDVRQAAAVAAAHVRGEGVARFFGKVFADTSAEVRLAGMLAIDEQPRGQRLEILDEALQSSHGDVQEMAIGDLQLDSTRRSLELMFQALDSPRSEVREEARFSIDFLIEREFSSAAEARAWWAENRNRFDEDLIPLD